MPGPTADIQQTLEPGMGPTTWAPARQPSESARTACTIPLPLAKAYLAYTLQQVKQFKFETMHRPEHEASNVYPPHALIYGSSVPTVYGAQVASRQAIKHADAYDDLAFAAGDGVVLASAAQLPPGYRCVKAGRVQSDRGHVGLLGDLEAVGRCLDAVMKARRRGIGLGS